MTDHDSKHPSAIDVVKKHPADKAGFGECGALCWPRVIITPNAITRHGGVDCAERLHEMPHRSQSYPVILCDVVAERFDQLGRRFVIDAIRNFSARVASAHD